MVQYCLLTRRLVTSKFTSVTAAVADVNFEVTKRRVSRQYWTNDHGRMPPCSRLSLI